MHLAVVSGIIEIIILETKAADKCRKNRERGGAPIDWSVKRMGNIHETQYFGRLEKEPENEAKRILMAVSAALREKGYNPVNQIVGYILSGDPTYITSHQNARVLIRKLERDELLEELVKDYLERNE